MRCKVLPK